MRESVELDLDKVLKSWMKESFLGKLAELKIVFVVKQFKNSGTNSFLVAIKY